MAPCSANYPISNVIVNGGKKATESKIFQNTSYEESFCSQPSTWNDSLSPEKQPLTDMPYVIEHMLLKHPQQELPQAAEKSASFGLPRSKGCFL